MLKRLIVCVMLVAASAMAWEKLAKVPAPVNTGEHLTWGSDDADGKVWGMFPSPGASKTYVCKYDPVSKEWDSTSVPPMSDSYRLLNTSLTFEWKTYDSSNASLWGCGTGDTVSRLYRWVLDSLIWRDYTIPNSDFKLREGATIAYWDC